MTPTSPERRGEQRPLRTLDQSSKLKNVLYEIRGPVSARAAQLENEGYRILKLNTGNPGTFGFDAPDVIMRDMIAALPYSQGYSESKGILSARRAVYTRYELVPGFPKLDVDDIYLGNGVSELIMMVMQALLDDGDEVLIPTPDYPLWTAATTLSRGTPVHYLCDEANDWNPSIEDIESKITDRTKAMVIINPNNPTGAVYSRETLEKMVEIARRHSLLLLSDEIYDRILYDDAEHVSTATLAPDLLCLTFNGLSKTYRVPGTARAGWPSPGRRTTRPASSRGSNCWPARACAPTCPRSTRSRWRSAATSRSTSSSPPAAGCTSSAPWRGRSSTRSRA